MVGQKGNSLVIALIFTGGATLVAYSVFQTLVNQNRQLASHNQEDFAGNVLTLIGIQAEQEFKKQFCLIKEKKPGLRLGEFFEHDDIKGKLEDGKFFKLENLAKKEAHRLKQDDEASGPLNDPRARVYPLSAGSGVGIEIYGKFCRHKQSPCPSGKVMDANPYRKFVYNVKEITSCGGSSPPTPPAFTSFAMGATHTCFIQKPKGALFCWGDNLHGQVGNGKRGFQTTPALIFSSGVTKVVASLKYTCAIVSEALYCWGTNYLSPHLIPTGAKNPFPAVQDSLLPVKIFDKNVKNIRMISFQGGAPMVFAIVGDSLYGWSSYGSIAFDGQFLYQPQLMNKIFESGVTSLGGDGNAHCVIVNNEVYCTSPEGFDFSKESFFQAKSLPKLNYLYDLPNESNRGFGITSLCGQGDNKVYCWDGRSSNCTNTPQSGGSDCHYTFQNISQVSGRVGGNIFCGIKEGALFCASVFQVAGGALSSRECNLSLSVSHVKTCNVFSSGVTDVQSNHLQVTCAIVDGALYCWGLNSVGLVGNSSINDISYGPPFQVFPSGVTEVAVSSSNVCALVNQEVFCWGLNGSSQLGIGISPILSPKTVISSGVKLVFVDQSEKNSDLKHSPEAILQGNGPRVCAIVNNGELYCWGYRELRELVGVPNFVFQAKPYKIFPQGVTDVKLDNGMLTLVNGALFSLGGRNGDPDANYKRLGELFQFKTISSGVKKIFNGPCAIVNNGELYCWGQIPPYYNGPPVQIFSSGVTDADPSNHSAVVNGALKVWHYVSNSIVIKEYFSAGVTKLFSPSPDSGPSFFANFTANGLPYRIFTPYIQLGPDVGVDYGPLLPPAFSGFSEIAIGPKNGNAFGEHDCVISRGALYCWGNNSLGQIGNNSTTEGVPPFQVFSSGVTQVKAFRERTCAIVNTALYCWGDNEFGQVGNGNTNPQLTPFRVIKNGVAQVEMGEDLTCAVLVSGELKCWGVDNSSHLGAGTNFFLTPQKVILPKAEL